MMAAGARTGSQRRALPLAREVAKDKDMQRKETLPMQRRMLQLEEGLHKLINIDTQRLLCELHGQTFAAGLAPTATPHDSVASVPYSHQEQDSHTAGLSQMHTKHCAADGEALMYVAAASSSGARPLHRAHMHHAPATVVAPRYCAGT